MKKYRCIVCDWIYDPAVGDPEGGIAILKWWRNNTLPSTKNYFHQFQEKRSLSGCAFFRV